MSAYPPGLPHMQPPQPPKSGMSKGAIIAVAAVLLVAGGIVLVAVVGVAGLLYYRSASTASAPDGAPVAAPVASGGASPAAPPSASAPSAAAERPSPTPEQTAALAGGKTAEWTEQGLSWTVPPTWSKASGDELTLVWRSPGSWDAASLISSVSQLGGDFPTEASLNAFYDQAKTKLAAGEVTEAKFLELDGVRGVMWREASPSDDEAPQRLQWMGYRTRGGQTQLLNVMVVSRGREAARYEPTLYGILYSTKIAR